MGAARRKIGINRGLLVQLNSEAELAAVLSHEIVHAAARHSAKSIERGLLVDGVLNAAGAALESSNVNYAGIVQDGARLGSKCSFVLRPGGGVRVGCLRHDLHASCWL